MIVKTTGPSPTPSEMTALGTTSTHLVAEATTPTFSLPVMLAVLAVDHMPISLTMMAALMEVVSIASATLASGMMTGHPAVETTTPPTGPHMMLAALVEEEMVDQERPGTNLAAGSGKPRATSPEMAVIGTPPTQETAMDPGIPKLSTPLIAAFAVEVSGKTISK